MNYRPWKRQKSKKKIKNSRAILSFWKLVGRGTKQHQIDGITTKTKMEERRDNKPSTVIKIAKDGDVILVVEPEEVNLRVHSLFLKAA
jgi:hypothetical protein